ncbi:MAG: GntR family transcriptional regulator [Spirochaetes bacterium]|nr:GntR family transcriptional regulator [Spirochaetota bacterium]MBU0955737.1 GntR family transcriptional regulator [Spirochaetota bacterium]
MHKKTDEISKKLEREILSGVWLPGDRLPPERELAERYEVSRSILRESIKHLAGLGLLRTAPQSGTYVTDYRQEASLEFLIYLLDNNETRDPEIFMAVNEFREILETACARRAAQRGGQAAAAKLSVALADMKKEADNPAILAERDFAFHACFVDMSGNLALRLLFNACRQVYLFYVEAFYRIPEHREHTFRQLELFITQIAARNPEKAEKALQTALNYGRDEVYAALDIDIEALERKES